MRISLSVPLRALAAAFALAAALAPRAGAQAIQLSEPHEWAEGAGAVRGITVQARQSLRVVGTANLAAGVTNVTINGVRASLAADAGGGVRFVGYVPVRDDTHDVQIAAYPRTGSPVTRSFAMSPTPAAQAYARPEQAWAGASRFKGKRWAVVVGVSQYHDNRINPLRYADADARAFYDFLRSDRAGLGGFKEENVKLLLNDQANYRSLRSALFTFLKSATDDDVVVIYFAGHGAADPERPDHLYLLLNDTDMDDIAGSAFPMKDMSEAVRNLYARNVVVITDACHSAGVGDQIHGPRGTAGIRDAAETNRINQAFLDGVQSSSGGSVIFTASGANQYSQEDARWGGGHGVFTHFLLDGLAGAADDDADRIVTLGEMMEYTRDHVRRETRNAQIPTISQTAFDDAWPMSIVTAPALPQPAALPTAPTPAHTGDRGDRPAPTPGPGRPITAGSQVASALTAAAAKLGDGSFYEEWTYDARAGERVTVTMKSLAFDAYLSVQQVGGTFEQSDDDGAGGTDARLTFTAPAAAQYRIRANSLSAGAMGAYTLLLESGAGTAPASVSTTGRAPTAAEEAAAAKPISAGQTVRGTLSATDLKLADGSFYQVWSLPLRRGQSVGITLRSAAYDAYLMVAQQGGGYSRNDDDDAGGTDARVTFTAPETGTYLLKANSVAAGATGAYTLAVDDGGGSDAAAPAPVAAGPAAAARPFGLGQTVSSSLSAADGRESDGTYYQAWRFTGQRGQIVTINLKSSAFDTYLLLEGPGRTFWASNDDGGGGTDSRIAITLPQDGEYTVKANALRVGGAGAYTLAITSRGIDTRGSPMPASIAGTLAAGQTVAGTLRAGGAMLADSTYYQEYRYEGHRGESVTITLKSKAFDAWLVVYQAGGRFLISDDDSGGDRDGKVTIAFPEDGTYIIRANTLQKREAGDYTLQVEAIR
ncbi:MAG: peptidase caspase catalytic subunit p20 [Gemmatimonadetes bacterium]|nr:peptidase caspase catalytic subunit p20 [Gemmatimonadota bacterium]